MVCHIADGLCFACIFDATLVLHRMVLQRSCQCDNCLRITKWFVKEPDTECSAMWGMAFIQSFGFRSIQMKTALRVDHDSF